VAIVAAFVEVHVAAEAVTSVAVEAEATSVVVHRTTAVQALVYFIIY
jgi:hypothetical protein